MTITKPIPTPNPNPNDQSVRQEAIDPSRSFLVQAPAGSGKTELLTDRVVALLAIVQRPEEIVAMTFTRAAAAEMHARVIEKLQSASLPEPEEDYKKQSWHLAKKAMANDAKQGWSLLEHPSRLKIRTIDSLSSHLVQAMPWLSGLGGVPNVSDQAKALYLEAARNVIARVDNDESVQFVVQHLGVDLSSLENLLINMLEQRDQWLPVLADAYGEQGAELLQHFLQKLVQSHLEGLQAHFPIEVQEKLAAYARYAHHNFIEMGEESLFPLLAEWSADDALTAEVFDIDRWLELNTLLLTASDPVGVRKGRGLNKKLGFVPKANTSLRNEALHQEFVGWLAAHEDASWIAPLHQIRLLQAEYSDSQLELLNHLVMLLRVAVAELRLVFIEHRQVDYIEIAQRALAALGSTDDPSELLLRLDRKISHILVDEFQDTSQNQLDLLSILTAGWEPSDGRTLFLVGDPMQSIYRFRKAEVGLFIQIHNERRLGDVALTPLVLSNNFRSTANIVDWVNRFGATLFPEQDDVELGAVSYSPSVAFNAAEPYSIIESHAFAYVAAEQEGRHKEQADALAEQCVVSLCNAALQQYPDSDKPVAILVRGRSHLGAVVRQLKAANIAVKAVEIDKLNTRPVVEDIVQLVRALSHAGDRLAWLSLLRSPICGLTLNSLHLLCGHDRHSTIEALIQQANEADWVPDEWQRLQHVATVLFDQSQRSGGLPFAAWVEHCWHRLGGIAAYPATTDQEDAEQLFKLLEQLAPYGCVDLEQLEDQVERLFAATQRAERAVEVMTIHRAKGLEYESVILYGLDRIPRANSSALLNIEQSNQRLYVGMVKASAEETDAPIDKLLKERDKEREAYELQRLLYVAVTRARSQLHLVASCEIKQKTGVTPSANSLLQLLWPLVEKEFEAAAAELVSVGQVAAETEKPYQALQRLKNVHALPPVAVQTVPSGDNEGHWEWEQDSFKEAAIGTVAHAWLERIGRDGINNWSVERIQQSAQVMQRQLLRAGVTQAEVTEAVVEVQDTLIRTLGSPQGQWLLRVAQAHREWTLLDASGRVSIIDLAISQENQWLIVDYKTAKPHEGQTKDEFLAIMRQRHGAQLQRYCHQVTAFDGRQAKAALYFPRADLWCEI